MALEQENLVKQTRSCKYMTTDSQVQYLGVSAHFCPFELHKGMLHFTPRIVFGNLRHCSSSESRKFFERKQYLSSWVVNSLT